MKMVGKIACCFMLLCMVVVAPHAMAAMTCGQVQVGVVSCLPYLTNHGPLGSCCSVTKGLVTAAKTPQDRRTACACVKSALNTIKGIDLSKAAGLSDVCHANIPFKPSLSTDCSRVN
nr:lipid transfer protein 1 [Petunia x hybrida]